MGFTVTLLDMWCSRESFIRQYLGGRRDDCCRKGYRSENGHFSYDFFRVRLVSKVDHNLESANYQDIDIYVGTPQRLFN